MIRLVTILFCFLCLSFNCFASDSCRVALVQSELVWGDVESNLQIAEHVIDRCKGVDLIVFPELFTCGCEMKKSSNPSEKNRNKDRVAILFPKILGKMRIWASQSGAMIIGSTIYKENNCYYNRLLAVTPDGTCYEYDKHNCFKKGNFTAGDKQLRFEWKGLRFATYICYDLRFEEWCQNRQDYDAAIYIANWPDSRQTEWNNLLQNRAMQNQAYSIGVNCQGCDLAGKCYSGDSQIVSSDGNKLVPYKKEKYADFPVLFYSLPYQSGK